MILMHGTFNKTGLLGLLNGMLMTKTNHGVYPESQEIYCNFTVHRPLLTSEASLYLVTQPEELVD
jgi:hypothetical protein